MKCDSYICICVFVPIWMDIVCIYQVTSYILFALGCHKIAIKHIGHVIPFVCEILLPYFCLPFFCILLFGIRIFVLLLLIPCLLFSNMLPIGGVFCFQMMLLMTLRLLCIIFMWFHNCFYWFTRWKITTAEVFTFG